MPHVNVSVGQLPVQVLRNFWSLQEGMGKGGGSGVQREGGKEGGRQREGDEEGHKEGGVRVRE